MSNEDVKEWPEIKGLPLKDDENAALIAGLASKVTENDMKANVTDTKANANATTIDGLAVTLGALMSELRKKGIIE